MKVPDPGDVLDPRTGSFTIALQLRSTLLANGRLPTASGASYNIVQKARSDDAGGSGSWSSVAAAARSASCAGSSRMAHTRSS